MAESNDIQALSLITSEIDESQIKVILSNNCIKAQAFLVDKIRKQLERQREVYTKTAANNTQLENEIKNAEAELKSLIIALQTVKSANIELRKEVLLAHEKKLEYIEHFRRGDIEYENVWQQCRNRFESIPYIKNWLVLTNTMQELKEGVRIMKNNSSAVKAEIETKTIEIRLINRKRIVELAEYIIHEVPKANKVINEKINAIATLKSEITKLSEALKNTTIHISSITTPSANVDVQDQPKNKIDDNLPNLYKNANNETMMLPKLHLKNIDLEAFSEKLDQIKKTGHMNSPSPKKRCNEPESRQNDIFKKPKMESMFIENIFPKQTNVLPYSSSSMNDKENKNQDYSKRKLINILEDIKIDSNVTMKIIAEVNPNTLRDVTKIEGGENRVEPQKLNSGSNKLAEATKDKKVTINEPADYEIIETVNTDNMDKIRPPSQFLDATQGTQESNYKKLSQELSLQKTQSQVPEKSPYDNENNVTLGSQLDVSSVNEESFVNLKNMLLKKNNLDLSPQFVYAKNTKLQKNDEDYVTSKFFEKETKTSSEVKKSVDIIEVVEDKNAVTTEENIETTEENLVCSSPKTLQPTPIAEKHVSGFLFNHGSCGIPESLNISINTTGMEDGDGDYPVPIDSSLLLSPKADMSVNDGNADLVQSQEVPNFLSGLRKTGLSFFGRMCTDTAADNSTQNQPNSFSFKFGGDGDKKSRGGLFNMFH